MNKDRLVKGLIALVVATGAFAGTAHLASAAPETSAAAPVPVKYNAGIKWSSG